jgi:hypothetical protein
MRMTREASPSLYIVSGVDVRGYPEILSIPAFDPRYVSLMVRDYDHYLNMPLIFRLGDL